MTTWKLSKNRGFYYGPDTDTPWNWDLMWKRRVDHEVKAQQVFLTRNRETEDGDELPPVRVSTPASVRSTVSFASKRSGAKTLQRSAPSALGGCDGSVIGSDLSAYREKGKESLINMLGRERVRGLDKEREFVRMLKKEHEARMISDRNMRRLEDKLNVIAQTLHVPMERFETQNAPKSFNNFSTKMYKKKAT